MKTYAAILYEINQPLRIEQIELPILKPGQVLVKVAYSGVCHSQLMEVRGRRGPDRFLPHLLGHEGSGVVVDVGGEVNKVGKGDEVVLSWIKGEGADCGGTKYYKDGETINAGAVTTFSEYAVVSENRCVRLPEGVPLDVAALLGCAVLTGAGIVLNTMRPDRQSTILVWGVGGIGLSAVMAARLKKCAVIIAVDMQDSKLELAKTFGATHVVNARTGNALARVLEIVGPAGVDYAVEAAGRAGTIEQAFQAVRKNGGLCVFASHPPIGERICLDPHDLISDKQIRGSWGGESFPDKDVPRFTKFYLQGKLPLEKLITHRYKLEKIDEALADLETGAVGRPLVEM
jgi:S-(hydroxymethyl)glutathione dehydrogenase/alcohol dehydrogenase